MVLIVTELFFPNDSTTAVFMTDIAQAISENQNIEVITTTELNGKKELSFLKGNIYRLKNSSLSKDNITSRIFKLLFSTLRLSWKTFFSVKNGDHIFAVTNPVFFILFLAIIKKIKKVKYTLLVYDVFPENVLASGLVNNDSYIYTMSKKMFDWAYAKADRLIVIGRDMEEVISIKTHGDVTVTIITNWCDTDSVKPLPKENNEIIKQLGIEKKTVFSFIGNLGRVQGIQTLLDAASLVDSEKFSLLFVGDGAMRPIVNEYIDGHPEGNVFYGGVFPVAQQNSFLNACDVALVSLNSSMYGLGVPSKSYCNMAAAKPLLLIGDENSEIGRVIKEEGVGWIVEPDDPEKLARLFEAICYDTSLLKKGKYSRKVAEQFYSKEIVMNKYKKLFSEESV